MKEQFNIVQTLKNHAQHSQPTTEITKYSLSNYQVHTFYHRV